MTRAHAGHACFECARPTSLAHHVVPVMHGGTRTVPLCAKCHRLAHGHDGKASDAGTLARKAKAKRRAMGYVYGRPPYGFRQRKDQRGYVKDGKRFDYLVMLLERRLCGWSSNQLARWMNAEHAPRGPAGQPHTRWSVMSFIRTWGLA